MPVFTWQNGKPPVLLKGFKFGMLLQLAVGPVCLYLFQASLAGGVAHAMPGVFAAMLVDGLYMGLAVLGFGAALAASGKAKRALRYAGAGILIAFGLLSVLGSLGVSVLPRLEISAGDYAGGVFVATFLLTLSNPLSIVFWLGVLSTRVARDGMGRGELPLFCAGCLLSTLLFLTLVVVLGRVGGWVAPAPLIPVLNVAVGLALVAFGVRAALGR